MSGTAVNVRRPTENAAMAGSEKYARPLPPLPALFKGLTTAWALEDRYGIRLFQAAIQRSVGRAQGGTQ